MKSILESFLRTPRQLIVHNGPQVASIRCYSVHSGRGLNGGSVWGSADEKRDQQNFSPNLFERKTATLKRLKCGVVNIWNLIPHGKIPVTWYTWPK